MNVDPALRVALAVGLVCSAACAPDLSDTGYVGTWVRGKKETAQSTLSIARDGERYLVRWTLGSADDRWKVTCDWDGPCVEFREGEKVTSYRFQTSIDPQTGHLIVECNGENHSGEGGPVHWIDELVVRDEGRTLVARAIVQGEQKFEGRERPHRRFTKLSDAVSDPPRPGTGG